MKPELLLNRQGPSTGALARPPIPVPVTSRAEERSALAAPDPEQLRDLAVLGPLRSRVGAGSHRHAVLLSRTWSRCADGWCELNGGAASLCLDSTALAIAETRVVRGAGSRASRGFEYRVAGAAPGLRLELAPGADGFAYESFASVYAPGRGGARRPGRAARDAGTEQMSGRGAARARLRQLARFGITGLAESDRPRPTCGSGLRVLLQIASEHDLSLELAWIHPGWVQCHTGPVAARPGSADHWHGAGGFELALPAAEVGRAWVVGDARHSGFVVELSGAATGAFLAVHLDGAGSLDAVPARWPSLMSYLLVRHAGEAANDA